MIVSREMIPIDCDQGATMHRATLGVKVSDDPDGSESDTSCVKVAILPRFDSQVVDAALGPTELHFHVLIGPVDTDLHDVDGCDDISGAGHSKYFEIILIQGVRIPGHFDGEESFQDG